MLNKCINCYKWITCNKASEDKNNCKDFHFERIKIKKHEKEIKYEEKKYKERNRSKKDN